MTRHAVVVSRKMDMPTAVVAMLGAESWSRPSESTLGPSAKRETPLPRRRQRRRRFLSQEFLMRRPDAAGENQTC